jgi:hypothetical protein
MAFTGFRDSVDYLIYQDEQVREAKAGQVYRLLLKLATTEEDKATLRSFGMFWPSGESNKTDEFAVTLAILNDDMGQIVQNAGNIDLNGFWKPAAHDPLEIDGILADTGYFVPRETHDPDLEILRFGGKIYHVLPNLGFSR